MMIRSTAILRASSEEEFIIEANSFLQELEQKDLTNDEITQLQIDYHKYGASSAWHKFITRNDEDDSLYFVLKEQMDNDSL